MKPIEPGCLALVIGAQNDFSAIGQEVRVVERTDNGEWHNGKCNTFGDEPWCWAAKGLRESGGFSYHLPHHLLRIDGDEHVSTEQREEVEA